MLRIEFWPGLHWVTDDEAALIRFAAAYEHRRLGTGDWSVASPAADEYDALHLDTLPGDNAEATGASRRRNAVRVG